ncbi:MAG: tetracycline resistance MFS efflux pump [Marinovum sp.]|jgi:DHA1 family tetracycline resistance protein-like MFS transporter|nr:tetracycline resistance MFS efflux pump [Marinovum sp.]NCX90854.1 MFS transporter [Paracoccaceae bacterium]|tara:strand:- start:449 stop:1666 length:1218 start_codon:yes stop_codon:yes gene_type:complete
MPNNSKLPIFVIFTTVVLDSMGIGIIIPVMPALFAEVTGSEKISDIAIWGGLLASTFALMQFIFGPILGALSDRYGRKPILLLALFVMAAYYLLMGFAQTLWLLFLGRLIGGITAATHATANAYMADISSPEEKAARFGMLGAGFGLGFVLGPLIGGLLGEWGPRAPFFAAAMLAAANGVLCYFVLKESLKSKNRREFMWYRANPIGAILDLRKFEGIYSLLLVFLLFTIGTSIYAAIWPFFTVERFSWSPGMIGISLTIYGVCFAIVQGVLVRPAIKIWGEKKTIIIGFCFEFSAMVTFAFLTDGKILIILIPLASLGVLAQPAIQAILSKSVGDDRQGAIQGVASSLNAIAMVITPITMTWILAVFSDKTAKYYFPGMPFLFSALMVLLCLFIISRRKQASTL